MLLCWGCCGGTLSGCLFCGFCAFPITVCGGFRRRSFPTLVARLASISRQTVLSIFCSAKESTARQSGLSRLAGGVYLANRDIVGSYSGTASALVRLLRVHPA